MESAFVVTIAPMIGFDLTQRDYLVTPGLQGTGGGEASKNTRVGKYGKSKLPTQSRRAVEKRTGGKVED